MKNATKIFFALALVLAGWSAGFFMGGGTGGEKGAVQSAANSRDGTGGRHGDSGAAVAGDSGGRAGSVANLTPEDRRGRVLSNLPAPMHQPNDMRKFRSVLSAIDKIGPEDIHAALDFAKKRTSNEFGGMI